MQVLELVITRLSISFLEDLDDASVLLYTKLILKIIIAIFTIG